MKKILIVAVIFLFVVTGCSDSNLKTVTLMLDYTPNTNHTGIYVAKEKGYYKDEGINLEIVDATEAGVEQSVAKGDADFGISYQENLTKSNDKGIKNLKSIYSILKENTSGFISYSDKDIKKPSDFKGKTYCGWGSDVESAIVKNVIKDAGLKEKDIEIVNGGTDFIRSNKDDCDIFWEFKAWSAIEARQENIDFNWISLKDLGLDWYTPIIITNEDNIENDSELVQSFINATIKGYEFATNNPEESANIFLKYNKTYDKDFIRASQKYISRYYLNDDGMMGYQEEEKYKNFTKFLKDNKIIKDVDYKELYTNEFVYNFYNN